MTVKFVPPRVPLVDLRTGTITREWYLLFQTLFTGSGLTEDQIQLIAPPDSGGNLAMIFGQLADDLATRPSLVPALAAPDDLGPSLFPPSPGLDDLSPPPLQLGTMAGQNADAVKITGGAISIATVLAAAGAILNVTAGGYTIDASAPTIAIAAAGTLDIPNFSGMVVVNNHTNGGVTAFLCGAGFTTALGSAGPAAGTMAYNGGVNGYRFTNTGGAADFAFHTTRTRPTG